MSNRYITVQMDRERKFRLTNSAVYKIEEKLGKQISKISENIYHKDILDILYEALKWDDKEITYDEAMELFDEYLDIGDTYKLFGDLASKSFKSPNGQGVAVEAVTAQVTEVGTGTQPSGLPSNVE